MHLREVIGKEKTDVKRGEWRDTPPKKSDFPMLKKRKCVFPLTKKWRWNTVSFSIGDRKFCLLIAYHKQVPEFQSVLAERVFGDSVIIARYEYHASHPIPGWHIHAVCDDFDGITPSVMKPLSQKRLPQVRNNHSRNIYPLKRDSGDDTLAENIAMECFGIPVEGDLFGSVKVELR